jgi:hypothetical protein
MDRSTLRVTRSRPVDPARLTEPERAALCDELYAVHTQIFDGVDPASFRHYVVEAPGAQTRLQVFREAHGEAVGYIAIHRYMRSLGDRPALVLRSEVGILRPFRGRALQARFVLLETARAWLKHWHRTKYVFACPVHPGSYYGVTRRATRSWPRPDQATPPAVATLMTDLADGFGLQRVCERAPMVRRVGWITRENAEDRAYWARHSAPEVRYYRRENPDYALGHGLLMLVPLTVPLVVQGVIGRALEVFARTGRSRLRR